MGIWNWLFQASAWRWLRVNNGRQHSSNLEHICEHNATTIENCKLFLILWETKWFFFCGLVLLLPKSFDVASHVISSHRTQLMCVNFCPEILIIAAAARRPDNYELNTRNSCRLAMMIAAAHEKTTRRWCREEEKWARRPDFYHLLTRNSLSCRWLTADKRSAVDHCLLDPFTLFYTVFSVFTLLRLFSTLHSLVLPIHPPHRRSAVWREH